MNGQSLTANSWEVVANESSRVCTQPGVSVVITLFNYSDHIGACLNTVRTSITEGIPGGFEVIVVDDGSTDSSVKVVETYLSASPMPLCLIKKRTNSGLADARNIGLLTARAPFVFILDADNEIRPECLLAHYQAINGTDYALVYGIVNQFDHATRKSITTMSHSEWDVRELLSRPYIDAMAMIRKEIVLQLGGYSTEYGSILPQGWEDYDLWLKLAQAGHSGKLIPRVLSDYRKHSQSMLVSAWPQHRELAAYFSRKFHALATSHADLPTLFGVSRRELAIASGQSPWLQARPVKKPPKFIHRLLGQKMCRSICKRLQTVYCWLYP